MTEPGRVGPPQPVRAIGMAAELASEWMQAIRRAGGASSLEWSQASRIVTDLLAQLVVRLDPARAGDEPPPDPPGDDTLPDVEDIVVLRSILHDRVAHRLAPSSVVAVLGTVDELVDGLLTAAVRRRVAKLESDAFIDPLTGTGNRRALERDLARELARAFRHGRPLSVVALDVDGLKAINDTQGHAAGDDLLRRLVSGLAGSLRVGDVVYRVGGDEFVILLPETDTADVVPLIERAAATTPAFSFGVASAPADAVTAESLLSFADAALIESRHQRRRLPEPEEADPLDLDSPVPPDPELEVEPPMACVEADGHRGGARIAITGVVESRTSQRFAAEVTLRRGDIELPGRSSGSSAGAAAKHIVAGAVLDAATAVDAGLATAYVEAVAVVTVGEQQVAIVNIVFVGDGEETTTGAAPVRERGVNDAVARAVLNALNRRLSMRLAEDLVEI